MADWSTAASLATAVGTLVLALATFVAVRAANRAARVAEYSMQIGIRPLLMPSRLEDPVQKIMWGDEFLAGLAGGEISARGAIAVVIGVAAIVLVPRWLSVPRLLGGYSALALAAVASADEGLCGQE